MPRGQLMSAVQLASAEVRDLIETGSLLPGSRINADELAIRLSISRTPVRDALQELRTEGLVEILPRRGVFVRRISKEEVRDVYAIKAAIEPLATARAAQRGTEVQRTELRELLRNMQRDQKKEDVRKCAEWVDAIHTHLFAMADSDVLRDVYRVFHERVKSLRYLNMSQPGRLTISTQQHEEIIAFVIDQNPTEAREAMLKHMTDAARSAQNLTTDTDTDTDAGRVTVS